MKGTTKRNLYWILWSIAWFLVCITLRNLGLTPHKATGWIMFDCLISCLAAQFLVGQKLLTVIVVIVLLLKWSFTPGAVGTVSFIMSVALLTGTFVFQPRNARRSKKRKRH